MVLVLAAFLCSKLTQNLVEKDKLDTTWYDDIVKKVKSEAVCDHVEIQVLNTCTRAEGETVSAYVAVLREIAHTVITKTYNRTCFMTGSCHDGVKHQAINRLLAEKDLCMARPWR